MSRIKFVEDTNKKCFFFVKFESASNPERQ